MKVVAKPGDILWVGVLVLVLAGTGAYAYAHRPCAAPVTYYVRAIDPRFNVSTSTVVALAKTSAALWNTAAGKDVLAYTETPNADAVPISLVFDQRQEAANVGTALSSSEAKDAQTRADLDAAEAQQHAASVAYDQAKTAYEAELSAYNRQVQAANQAGGANAQQFAQFAAEKQRLQADQAALNAQADSLNAQSRALQSRVADFNAHVRATNSAVTAYNASAGSDFNAGEYVADAAGRRITIYEFTDAVQLTRVLAHELGHALGLQHNTNPDSIMYPYNTSQNTLPTSDDTAALAGVCAQTPQNLLAAFHR